MSYFFAGFGEQPLNIQKFDELFLDTVPPFVRKQCRRFEKKSSFLVTYGSEKPIKDIIIQDTTTDSWLALLGTPLLNLPSKKAEQDLLNRFRAAPQSVLKNEIDGCFALVHFNAPDRTLMVAADYNNTTPLYFASASDNLYISSNEFALAKFLKADIDPEGFAQTIQLKLTWGYFSRFKNIKKLLPCQFVTFKGNVQKDSTFYWHPSEEELWPKNLNATIDKWSAVLKESVKAYHDCSTNKNVICDFTAGEDSRLLLSQCHALGIPFKAQVTGLDTDMDVVVAKEASGRTGFELIIHRKHLINEEQLLENATYISLMNDGYQDYFKSCTDFANDAANPPLYYDHVKYCGAPGGEAFRGSYYLRGKAFFPSAKSNLDSLFFVKMKYLLDFHPGLMRFPDNECKQTIFTLAQNALDEIKDFPVGTKIDHLLRLFQTCNAGLIYKNPRYVPFASKDMTRSIYSIWPHLKRAGALTKACTEILFPQLARIKTQNGVPTIRRTPQRFFLFLPERVSLVKNISRGALGRLFKISQSNKSAYNWNENSTAITTMLKRAPFSNWFSSPSTMVTGYLYNSDCLNSILSEARAGGTRYVPILGRVICQELACRWVNESVLQNG